MSVNWSKLLFSTGLMMMIVSVVLWLKPNLPTQINRVVSSWPMLYVIGLVVLLVVVELLISRL